MNRVKPILAAILMLTLLTGCSNDVQASHSVQTSDKPHTLTIANTTAKQSTSANPTAAGDFVCNPHLFYDDLSSPEIYEYACALVDAIEGYEDHISLPNADVAGLLADSIFYNYPPAALCKVTANGSEIDISYTYDKIEHIKRVDAFYERVEAILSQTVSSDMSCEQCAAELYRYVSSNVKYFSVDYTPADTSAYSAIIQGKSICYGFSDCYNYLLRQVGIHAELVRGYRAFDRAEHGWSMIMLNGKGYHCDTTWEASTSSGLGLTYYCMTDAERFKTIARDSYIGLGSAKHAYSGDKCSDDRYAYATEVYSLDPWSWDKIENLLKLS